MAGPPLVLANLAVEILFTIAAHATKSDQVSLSMVSTMFNSVATKLLYRDIGLTSLKRMALCCRTLASKPETALSVRTLFFDHFSDGRGAVLPSFFRLLNSALLNTTNLNSLVLSLPCDRAGITLQHCFFPRLESYSSFIHGHFLDRHPTIKSITVLGRDASVLLPTYLPLLEDMNGTSDAAKEFVPHRPVQSVTIEWPNFPYFRVDSDADLDSWGSGDVIDSLVKSTYPGGIVSLTSVFIFLPPIQMLGNLGNSLANLETLHLRIVCQGSDLDSPYEEFLDEMKSVLPQFRCLLHLYIQTLQLPATGSLSDQMARELSLVRDWGASCSTLHACILNSCVQWSRFPCASPTFWVPSHPDPHVTSNFLIESFAQASREGGLPAIASYFRQASSFLNHLAPESPLHPLMLGHLVGLLFGFFGDIPASG
ncbi:hypothetical protein DFH06DRAFT_1296590 [Mycena polygramma]|nr:hypothetical protein DFH06DRAFT_1296590 [Mycena polygramma]